MLLTQELAQKNNYVKNIQKPVVNVVNVFLKNILKKDRNEYIIDSVCANLIITYTLIGIRKIKRGLKNDSTWQKH